MVSGNTVTVRGLAGRWPLHLGHLITPAKPNSIASITATGLPWAVDNGAFSGFDPAAFRRLLGKCGGQPRLLWVACPDVVGNARGTLAWFAEWQPVLRAAGVSVALVGQDGMEDLDVPWEDCACLFLGGSTRWKLSQASADLGTEARRQGKGLHMGRCNTRGRIRAAHDRGCDSIDGKSFNAWKDIHLSWALPLCRRLETQERSLFA